MQTPTTVRKLLPVFVCLVAGGLGILLVPRLVDPDPALTLAADEAAPALPVRYKIPVSDTQPSLGPRDALVTVVEWCDMRGEACRRANAAMRSLLHTHEGRLRWVHRALVDAERPEESLRAHNLARAAFQHAGKFWEMRDWFLALPDDAVIDDGTLQRAAESVGIDYAQARTAIDARSFAPALTIDRVFAGKFAARAPVAFHVNGMSVPLEPGADLSASLRPVIAAELDRAERLVKAGVAPEDVYDTIIQDASWGVGQPPVASASNTPVVAADGTTLPR